MAQTTQAKSLQLSSPAFQPGRPIPSKYTCDGANISPALSWSGVPAEARSLALIVEDPDAPSGDWVHWVLFNLPVGHPSLEEAIPKKDRLPNGAVQGVNNFGETGYGGPCPPKGTHRYYFRLYALDGQLDLNSSAKKDDVVRGMQGRVLAQGELMGTYSRNR